MQIHYTEHTTDMTYRTPRWLKFLRFFMFLVVFAAVVSGGTVLFVWNAIQAPTDFPVGERIVIEEGQSVDEIAKQMKALNIVKYDMALYTILVMFHDPTSVKASTYIFKTPQTALEIAERLVKGEFGIDLLRFVHYEGERNELLADRAAELLPDFDKEKFLEITADKEGRMFPDTYLIPETYTAEELATLLESTFEAKMEPLRDAIENSNYTEDEVIILASLIEREANTYETKRMVSGIINNRINEGMPLQLDASVEYVLDKPLSELTAADLKIDSPYNTYLNPGLPPTPIGNPGRDAIEAVLRPTASSYLFYLTGRDGQFYYATNLAGHNRNIALYLR